MTNLVPANHALVRDTHMILHSLVVSCTRVTRSFHHAIFMATVIGFETGSTEATEYRPNEREAELVLFTPMDVLSATTLQSTLKVTVGVNDSLSTATLGNPISTDQRPYQF